MSETTVRLTLRPGVTASREGDRYAVAAGPARLVWEHLEPELLSVLTAFSDGGATEGEAVARVAAAGMLAVPKLYTILAGLDASAALRRELRVGQDLIATLIPVAAPFAAGADHQLWRLSRFALARRDGDALLVESARGRARVLLHDGKAAAAFAALAEPQSAASLSGASGLPEEAAHQVLRFLSAAEATVDAASCEEDDLRSPLAWWEFHDLLFHWRSRQGRHGNPYGGTFHRKGKAPPPPLVKPPMEGEVIPLHVPDLEERVRTDRPFSEVLESRRSIRDYDEQHPVTLGELGEFLYRTARIQHVIKTGPDDMDYSYRPAPGGGAIHEIEVYAVVGNCAGLGGGIYHYDPLAHQLRRISGPAEEVDQLLTLAWITADRKSRPNVYFVFTARFQRLQWKYQSMVYAAVLKNVGVLYQTMYLVATAMDLAPCSLGGGNSDRFGRMLGLDPYEESAVGEFVLGRRRRGDGTRRDDRRGASLLPGPG